MFFILITIDLILYICSGILFFSDNRTSSQLMIATTCVVLAIILSICILIYYRQKLKKHCSDCTPDCAALDCIDCDGGDLECCGLDCT